MLQILGARQCYRIFMLKCILFSAYACNPNPPLELGPWKESIAALLPPAYDEQGNICEAKSSALENSSYPCTLNLSKSLRSELWTSFCLEEACSQPSWWPSKYGGWELRSSGSGLQGIVMKTPIKGHFEEEVGFDLRDGLSKAKGLILFAAQDLGKGRLEPNYNAYIALLIDRDDNGYLRVKALDQQPSQSGESYEKQVLDRTGRLTSWEKEKRYTALLDGSFSPGDTIRNDYRVPFTESTGRLKILHHSSSLLDGKSQPFFYLSYTVKKDILHGVSPAEGWMNLAPLASWLGAHDSYFVGLVMDASDGGEEARFTELLSRQQAHEEPEEESTSFRLIKRPYNWSGFNGDAWQVQFGQDFKASKKYRLVFWSEMNNVPAWHINDQLLLTNSFVELWPENRRFSKGCFEAMSDGLRWNNEVKILADTPARKVIHWRAYLFNPAYQTIAQTLAPTQQKQRGIESLARSDEIWTVYPDGTAFRQVFYSPDQQGFGADSYEIAELSVIAGARSDPVNHAQDGASLELWNPMSNEAYRFRPSHGKDLEGNWYGYRDAPFNKWDKTIAVAKVKDGKKNAPYIYSAFAQPWAEPRVSGEHALNFDVSWHGYEWQFSHWPQSREPYEFHDQTRTTWSSQVSHSALVSVQVTNGGRTSGEKAFVSLVGINSDAHAISARVQDWSYPPEVKNLQSCSAPWYNAWQGHLELEWTGSRCSFDLESRFQGRDTVPVVLKMKRISKGQNFRLSVNDRNLSPDEWKLGFEFEKGEALAIFFIPGQPGGIWRVSIES